jgi:hypothetical protein
MSLMVKFGNKVIVNTNMTNVIEDIKKNEWTDNKLYRSATRVDIKPLIGQKDQDLNLNAELVKIQKNRETIERIVNSMVNTSNDTTAERLNGLIKNLEDANNKDYTLTRKRNYENLLQTFRNIKIDQSELNKITEIKEEEISKFNKSEFMIYINKYQNLILKDIPYSILNGKEESDLIKFLDDEERKAKGIHDINDFDYGNLNLGPPMVVGVPNLCQSESNGFFRNNDMKKEFSGDKLIGQDLIVNDFKKAANCNKNISNEQLMGYIGVTDDLNEAAKLYYEDIYGTLKLNLTYWFPNKKVKQFTFNMTDDPSELIMVVYKEDQNANDPKLYISETQQIIIPEHVKFIGGLNLTHNSKIIVKYY